MTTRPADNGLWEPGGSSQPALCTTYNREKEANNKEHQRRRRRTRLRRQCCLYSIIYNVFIWFGSQDPFRDRKCNFGWRLSSNLALRFHTKEPSNREGGGGASDGLCGSSLGTEDRRCVPDLSPSPSFFLPALNSALVPSPEY